MVESSFYLSGILRNFARLMGRTDLRANFERSVGAPVRVLRIGRVALNAIGMGFRCFVAYLRGGIGEVESMLLILTLNRDVAAWRLKNRR